MSLDRTLFRLEVTETDRGRAYWASREYLSKGAVDSVRSAGILVVPWEDRGAKGPSFPAGTTEFLRALRARHGNVVAIAADPDNYVELSLHANEVRWPIMFLSAALAGAVGNVIGTEVEKLIGSKAATTVEASIILENHPGKCVAISYKGPPERLVESLQAEISRCLSSAPTETAPRALNAKDSTPKSTDNRK